MSDTRDPDRDQVAPIPQDENVVPSAHDVLIEMIKERKEFGLKKYQTVLQGGNGRNPVLDILEELIDASVYAVTQLQEQETTCPRWAQVILRAYFHGEAINFDGCFVPQGVQDLIREYLDEKMQATSDYYQGDQRR